MSSTMEVSSLMETVDLQWGARGNQSDPLETASDLILEIGSTTVLVFGMFGNVMIILIMLRLPASTSSVFFQVLAWSDLLVLMKGPLENLLHKKFGVPNLQEEGSWQCKIMTMMMYVTSSVSSWMLVALTMLRAASVLWPHRVNAVWTKGMSRGTAVVLIVAIILINCHFLYGHDFDVGCSCCRVSVSGMYQWFFDMIWPWIDLLQFCFLPFVLLVISNSVLLWTLFKSVKLNTRLSIQQANQDSRQRKVSSLTMTLIATSISFFLLTSPTTIFMISAPYVDWSNPILNRWYTVFRDVGFLLWHANSAVNFYLYCLTGGKFRAEFLRIPFDCCSLCHKAKNVGSQQRSF